MYAHQNSYPLCSAVLMLKPKVGEILVMSSAVNFLRMVVLPALSKPLCVDTNITHSVLSVNLALWASHRSKTHSIKSRMSFSFCFIFFNIVISPILPLPAAAIWTRFKVQIVPGDLCTRPTRASKKQADKKAPQLAPSAEAG